MICWYCKNLIADNTAVCPCCGVAVVNPVNEEFIQNGYVNPYEQYYRNFQLPQMPPQMNSGFTGQYYQSMGGVQAPQFPVVQATPMPMPMQNPFAPYQVVGVIYPQPQHTEEPRIWVKPKEQEKPEIEDVVKDEPVVVLEQSEVDGSYTAKTVPDNKETQTAEVKNTETATSVATEPKKKNALAIAGFIFAFILPLIGLILSCVALSRAETKNYDRCGLSIAGVVISIVMAIAYPVCFYIFSEPLLTLLGF